MNKRYPVKSDPPTECHCKIDVAERPTPINRIKFSGIIKLKSAKVTYAKGRLTLCFNKLLRNYTS
jgi:hypothetical protein